MIALIVVLYALFASTFSLGKVLLGYAQPIFLVGIRMSVAGLVLLGYQYITTKGSLKVRRDHVWDYLKIIIFTTYLPYILRFTGLRYLPSSKACLLYNTSPFVSYIFAYFFAAEKITPKKIIGLLIGFVGFMPLLTQSTGSMSITGMSLPEIFILLSVCSMSYGWLIVHKLIKEHRYEASLINGISMFCGGILALITSYCLETPTPIEDTVSFLTILGVVIVVSNLICHTLYTSLLTTYSPTFLSFASFISPLCAAAFGWFFLNETISWHFVLASSSIIIGLTLFYRDEMEHQRITTTVQQT